MDDILIILFSVSILLILHTYLFYPVLMILLFSKRRRTMQEYANSDDLPQVAVLIAAYNEEKVIRQKIESVFQSNYPSEKLKVYVGSDASEDDTNQLLDALKKIYPNLEVIKFSSRSGKISIINHLQSLSNAEILIMTDANVNFTKQTIIELIKKFKEPQVGLVAANIVKESLSSDGITEQEKTYLSLENRIKNCESNGFQLIMGAEGGCYAIRDNLFSKVPLKFIVDDFFITLQVLTRKKMALFNPNAICIEDVDSDISGEYRRKVRISSGNFQNLFFFKQFLLPIWSPISFTFWSHKVLRWLTPFFLLICLISSAILMFHYPVFYILFSLQFFGLLLPLFNHILEFKNSKLKFISHFYLMNLALLHGFFRFCKGIQSSVWQPVKRNV